MLLTAICFFLQMGARFIELEDFVSTEVYGKTLNAELVVLLTHRLHFPEQGRVSFGTSKVHSKGL